MSRHRFALPCVSEAASSVSLRLCKLRAQIWAHPHSVKRSGLRHTRMPSAQSCGCLLQHCRAQDAISVVSPALAASARRNWCCCCCICRQVATKLLCPRDLCGKGYGGCCPRRTQWRQDLYTPCAVKSQTARPPDPRRPRVHSRGPGRSDIRERRPPLPVRPWELCGMVRPLFDVSVEGHMYRECCRDMGARGWPQPQARLHWCLRWRRERGAFS